MFITLTNKSLLIDICSFFLPLGQPGHVQRLVECNVCHAVWIQLLSYHVIHLQNHRSGCNKKDRASNVEELHSNGFLNHFLISDFAQKRTKSLWPDQPVHVDIQGMWKTNKLRIWGKVMRCEVVDHSVLSGLHVPLLTGRGRTQSLVRPTMARM